LNNPIVMFELKN